MGCGNCFFNKLQEESRNSVDTAELEKCSKLSTTDWLKDYSYPNHDELDLFEVRFKNTRKDFFTNPYKLKLKIGDVVIVDANQGYDTGIISLTGILAKKQYQRKVLNAGNQELKNITRKATYIDIDKWKKARKREFPVMIRARQIAGSINLNMKIGDVEFQGDGNKAIFYYIAEERVDFRELIKLYAKEFYIKIEMRQIGARQEAAKIGGIASCGRELCCSTWRTDFTSITAAYARIQELPVNAQKLAGQCGKLKCCLTYELESYLDAREDFPKELIELETDKGIIFPVKIDVLKKTVWYSENQNLLSKTIPLHVERIKEIINLNKRGIKVKDLLPDKYQDKDILLNNSVDVKQEINPLKMEKKRFKKRKRFQPKQ